MLGFAAWKIQIKFLARFVRNALLQILCFAARADILQWSEMMIFLIRFQITDPDLDPDGILSPGMEVAQSYNPRRSLHPLQKIFKNLIIQIFISWNAIENQIKNVFSRIRIHNNVF